MKKLLPGISVAVVTRNRARKLQDCLKALNSQTLAPYEVLVIDNASEDKTKKIAESFEEKMSVRYFYEEKIGIPFARNRALQEAKTEILAFTDDDCRPTRDWLEEMYLAHQRFTGETAIQGESFSSKDVLGIISTASHEFTIRRHKDNKNLLLYLDTKNVSLKMKTILAKKILFDTDFPRGSDSDFGKRLLFNKEKILFYPQAKVFFGARENIFSFLKQRFDWGKANGKMEQKWPRDFFPSAGIKKTPFSAYLLDHHLLKKNLWLKPVFFVILSLSRNTEKLGRFFGKLETRYQKLAKSPEREYGLRIKNLYHHISVAIITRNRPQLIFRCLQSLSNQTKKPAEVLIIDSSKDEATKNLVSFFSKKMKIKVVKQEKLGRGAARNTAIDEARGDILLFIDDDLETKEDLIEKTIFAHNLSAGALSIQGRILSKEDTPWAIAEQFRLDRWFLERMEKVNNLSIITTKNVSFKLKKLREAKIRFAEHYDSAFADLIGEDVDFAKQILTQNKIIQYFPEAIVYHQERASLQDFYRQQYRKGYSYGLVKNKWPQYYQTNQSSPVGIRFLSQRLFFPFLEVFFYPSFKRHILKIVPVLCCYFLSVFAYFYGYRHSLSKQRWLDQFSPQPFKPAKIAKDFTVVIVTRNRSGYLKRCLFNLLRQTVGPVEILVIDNASSDNTQKVIATFMPYMPLRSVIEKKRGIACVRNRALREIRTEYFVSIDDDCETPTDWLEKTLEGYSKYPKAAAVQGLAISVPGGALVSIYYRFRRQSWIRDNMLSNRNLFWKLIGGKEKRGIPILFCDGRNFSFKMSVVRKFKLIFDENLRIKGDDYDFAKQLLSHQQKIIFYPRIFVYHHEGINFWSFVKGSFCQGKASNYLLKKWPKKYFPPRERQKRFLRRLVNFVYFCLANHYFLKLPSLFIIFLVGEAAFALGKREEI